jgi:glutamate formiminotransferase/formiminotetrahydrofolate cyclodeaminase
MVARLTIGKEKYKDVWEEMENVANDVDEIRKRLLELVDEDTRSYEAIVAARKQAKETPEQKKSRQKAIDDATILATTVPMQSASFACVALAFAPEVAEKGNPNAASDVFVAALLLQAAIEGALANVRINLPGIGDEEIALGFRQDADDLGKKAADLMTKVREAAKKKGLTA